MARREPTMDYCVIGGLGQWFAWRRYGDLPGWYPHVREIWLPGRKGRLRSVTAVQGRTPFEALERLKRIEARVC